MIPVDQTIFGAPAGNCLPACIASLLHLAVAEVPNICEAGEGWLERLAAWLRPRGLTPLLISGGPPEQLGGALCIVSGLSPRGPWLHATVWRGGELIHDPHPIRAGLLDVSDTLILVPLDPRPINAPTSAAACTGITARWCPRCGDCKCPPPAGLAGDMDAPGCPLHALDSTHGEGDA